MREADAGRMADREDDTTGKSAGRGERRARSIAGNDLAFDQWVARQLHKAHDEILQEDVPADLLRIVERFGTTEATKSEEQAGAARRRGLRRRED